MRRVIGYEEPRLFEVWEKGQMITMVRAQSADEAARKIEARYPELVHIVFKEMLFDDAGFRFDDDLKGSARMGMLSMDNPNQTSKRPREE